MYPLTHLRGVRSGFRKQPCHYQPKAPVTASFLSFGFFICNGANTRAEPGTQKTLEKWLLMLLLVSEVWREGECVELRHVC